MKVWSVIVDLWAKVFDDRQRHSTTIFPGRQTVSILYNPHVEQFERQKASAKTSTATSQSTQYVCSYFHKNMAKCPALLWCYCSSQARKAPQEQQYERICGKKLILLHACKQDCFILPKYHYVHEGGWLQGSMVFSHILEHIDRPDGGGCGLCRSGVKGFYGCFDSGWPTLMLSTN